MIKIQYEVFKNSVLTNGQSFLEEDCDNCYQLIGTFDNLQVMTMVLKDTAECTDYETNYKASANIPKFEVDDDGRQIIRTAAGIKGWTYCALFFEFETASGSLVAIDAYGSDISSQFEVKRFDSNGDITTSTLLTVRTEVTWKPTFDYELIGGNIRQASAPLSSIHVGVVGGCTDLGGIYERSFASGLNLLRLTNGDHIETDGRASKYMKYTTAGVPYPTNKIKFIAKHTAGTQHWVMANLEIFRG